MSAFTDFGENKLVDWIRQQTLSLPANWYLALGSASSDGSFTELTGTGYARAVVPRSLAKWAGTQGAGTTLASSGTSHQTSNNDPISWGTPGSAWGTANRVGFFDLSSGGNCWMHVEIDAITITTGSPDPVELLAGALVLSIGATGGCSDYLANKLVDLIWRGQAYSFPATIYLALFGTAPTNAGGGTELSGGSYARAALALSLTSMCGTHAVGSTDASSGTGGRTSNNAPITFPAPTADQGVAVAEVVKDASTGGNQLFSKAIPPKTIAGGGPAPSHAANTFGLTLA